MDKNGVVQFGDWNKGQAKHAVYGFGLLQNVEVFENRGIAKLNNRTLLFLPQTYFTLNAMPVARVSDIYGSEFIASQNRIYKNGDEIAFGLTNVWDMAIWHDYLWVRHSNVISAYGPLSQRSNAQWFPNIETGFSATYYGKLLLGQDDFLYSSNGNYVAKMTFSTGGTIGVAPTISTTLNALDLKDGQFVSTLIEHGRNILIGTGQGSNYADQSSFRNAKIYPWNRQAGTLGNPGLADLPVSLNENGTWMMIEHANRAFVVAGTQGNVYETDGTSYRKIATLPFIQNGILSSAEYFPNAIAISQKGTLLIGVSVGSDGLSKAGVYEIDINDSNYPVVLKNTISTGTVSSSSGRVSIGFVAPTDYQTTKIGWRDVNSYGVDTTDFRMYASYGGVIETPLVKVGSTLSKYTFQHIEWCLAEPLVAGQNIRISYRLNNKDSYTLINTWGYSTVGAVLSFEDVAGIADAEYIQLKIELDQALTTAYGSNIYLTSVSLS